MLAHFDAGFTTFDLADHYAENARVFELTLAPEDHERIEAVTSGSRDLFRAIGDCGDEYRR